MEEWKPIEPNMWKPEKEGDSITGVLINKEPKTGELSARYKLENETGWWLVWGSATLDDRMDAVRIGDKVRITYKETKDLGRGKTLKIFKVELAVGRETTDQMPDAVVKETVTEPEKETGKV